MIRRYDSIAALGRDAKRLDAYNNGSANLDWFGGERAADSVRYSQIGNDTLVPEAERLIARIDAAIEVSHREIIADRAGAYPIVPDFLQGIPDCMRRRAPVASEAAPLSIYVSLGCSAELDAGALMARGTAILALVMAMSRARPVDLHVVHAGGLHEDVGVPYCVMTAPINTRPLDLATAAYALSSAGFVRRLVFGLQFATNSYTGGFPSCHRSAEYLPGLLRALGGDPARDLIVGPAMADDALIADPVAWVNAQIARFRDNGDLPSLSAVRRWRTRRGHPGR